MPVVLQNLLSLYILGVNHKATGVAVETMDNMGSALLMRMLEIGVEYSLYIEGRMAGSHGKNANIFFNNNEPTVFVNNL